jgi:hypothetical protein
MSISYASLPGMPSSRDALDVEDGEEELVVSHDGPVLGALGHVALQSSGRTVCLQRYVTSCACGLTSTSLRFGEWPAPPVRCQAASEACIVLQGVGCFRTVAPMPMLGRAWDAGAGPLEVRARICRV